MSHVHHMHLMSHVHHTRCHQCQVSCNNLIKSTQVIVVSWVVNDIDNLYFKYSLSSMQHINICNRNVFTNCLPCSHTINLNNETCLVTCAHISDLYFPHWCVHTFLFDLSPNQDTSIMQQSHYTRLMSHVHHMHLMSHVHHTRLESQSHRSTTENIGVQLKTPGEYNCMNIGGQPKTYTHTHARTLRLNTSIYIISNSNERKRCFHWNSNKREVLTETPLNNTEWWECIQLSQVHWWCWWAKSALTIQSWVELLVIMIKQQAITLSILPTWQLYISYHKKYPYVICCALHGQVI